MNIEDIISMFTKEELNELKYILGDKIAKKYYFYAGFEEECVSLKEQFGDCNKSTFRCLNENETRSYVRKKIFEFTNAVERSNDIKQLLKELAIDVEDYYFDDYNSKRIQYGCFIYAIFEERIASHLTNHLLNNNLPSEQSINYIMDNSNNNLVCICDTWVFEDTYDCHELNENQNTNYYILDFNILVDELNNLGFINTYLDRYDTGKSPLTYKNLLYSNFDDDYYSFLAIVYKRLQKENELDMDYKKIIKK